MTTATHFLRRDPADVRPWAETCGQIRCLIEEKDGAAGEVHHVEIKDAKLHYHERTDEFYYVIAGQGTMRLDDEEKLRPDEKLRPPPPPLPASAGGLARPLRSRPIATMATTQRRPAFLTDCEEDRAKGYEVWCSERTSMRLGVTIWAGRDEVKRGVW